MDRSFVIAHISDLHLDGSGRLLPTIEALTAALRERMADFADVPDRILLITGDIVDDPTPRSLEEAVAVIASFRQTGLFTDIQAVAGNHDAKRPSQRGGRHNAYDYLRLPRTSKTVYYRQAGLDLMLLDSNGASLTALAHGNFDEHAYHALVAQSARLSVELAGALGSSGRADYSEPAENLVRVLALHHHPLPQATGEGKRFLGAADEPLMYLAAPATFLEAATSLNVSVVLHGHRHVEGLARYSIPDPRATRSSGAEFWRTIYVLSCPSSTGQGGDDAGFNIVHVGPTRATEQPDYRITIARYSRPRNDAAFSPLDSNMPDGRIGLPLGRDLSRDPAIQSAIEIASCASLNWDRALPFVRQLLSRPAFYDDEGQGWPDRLYTYLVTSHTLADLDRRLDRSAPRRRVAALAEVEALLGELIGLSADMLDIDRATLDEFRAAGLISRDDLKRRWPALPRGDVDIEGARQRLDLLRTMNDQVKLVGLDLDLGGEAPPQGSIGSC